MPKHQDRVGRARITVVRSGGVEPISLVRTITGLTAILVALGTTTAAAWAQGLENGRSDKDWSVMLFGGPLVEQELAGIIFPGDGIDLTGTTFVGVALNKRVYEFDQPFLTGFTIELEGGVGYQFGDSADETGQVWGAAYLRYDAFPWNHIVRTSVAGSIGLNYITEKTAFENAETKNGDTKNILHYFSPEITFAAPSNPDDEFVVRLHHRSGAQGAFGCEGCGSNYITFGYRKRF